MTQANDLVPSTTPFFILGCVRSGTTMLRDALRMHPHLACPEETHFFRLGDPYGTEAYTRFVQGNSVLKKHRTMDGITEEEFAAILASATSKADLYKRYMALYMQRAKPGATRWFDKTPQNVYGALLASNQMPRAKFVHIVRNPLNVVASLHIGRIVKVDNLVGAVNYWTEAIHVVRGLRRAYPARVHELRYEDFVQHPMEEMQKLLTFLEEPFDAEWFSKLNTRLVDHAEEPVLSAEDKAQIKRLCRLGMERYGYLPTAAGEKGRKVTEPTADDQGD